MNLLYLIRHGENPANLTKQFSHRLVDHPLTEKGILQAQQTAAYLQDKRLDALYASPLLRARQTAEIIGAALGLPVTVLEQFREVDVGELEARPSTPEAWAFHDAIMGHWRAGRHTVAFPGGEDYVTLLARMRAGLVEALTGRDGQRLAIVGHGGIFAATAIALCPEAAPEIIYQPIPNCGIGTMEMELAGDELAGRLLSWATCDHLSGVAAQLVPGTPAEAAEAAEARARRRPTPSA